jgi:serine/threonine protein kinase
MLALHNLCSCPYSRTHSIMRIHNNQTIITLSLPLTDIMCSLHFYYTPCDTMICPYITSIHSVARQYQKSKQPLPMLFVKLYLYQLARALAHIHALGICHRYVCTHAIQLHTYRYKHILCDIAQM